MFLLIFINIFELNYLILFIIRIFFILTLGYRYVSW
eukprot:UN03686